MDVVVGMATIAECGWGEDSIVVGVVVVRRAGDGVVACSSGWGLLLC